MPDPRSLAALDVAERHANGMATDDDLRVARAATEDAAREAQAAVCPAWAAVCPAWAAAFAAARAAALAAAGDGERQAQAAEFLRIVGGE